MAATLKRKKTIDDGAQLEWPEFKPTVIFPTVSIPQKDGSFLVKPGKPQVVGDEVSTTVFAKLAGLSQRRVEQLCEVNYLQHRRPGGPRGKILIPKSELQKAMEYQK